MYALQETLTNDFDWVDMVLASANASDQGTLTSIRYTTTPVDGAVLLSIWEIAAPTTSRPASYLYKLNYRVSSDEEAQSILSWYLYGVTEAAKIMLPQGA